ncbi:MAG: hypothetical protein UT63_C0092G0002 [Candidatus Gottesmanbacteria bacterium GW2011_GWC2_39_8]|uniref:Uncharacterized protein n=1 Tax=Candidatus Gottesmanbacteria bacterium GW2011_GWC2_39_8 TaxID=1618450 RepID=A0A0G0SYY0_9BACT|nr:MAG: hypothetical protein UT63_C0092G0002 [Candidatus Gottesmanbacteria bacterium GW2011_GWC2_39_8]
MKDSVKNLSKFSGDKFSQEFMDFMGEIGQELQRRKII